MTKLYDAVSIGGGYYGVHRTRDGVLACDEFNVVLKFARRQSACDLAAAWNADPNLAGPWKSEDR